MPEERRESRRFPVLEGREKIELKIGRRLIPGRLVDISAGGFAVEVALDEQLQAGLQVEMRTRDGAHIVQIARVAPLENALSLGIVRIEDVVVPEGRRPRDRRMSRAGNRLFLLPVIAGVVVCAITVGVACMGTEWTEATIINPASQALSRAFNFDDRRKLRTRYGAPSAHPSPDDNREPAEAPADRPREEIGSSWTAWSDYMELSTEQLHELKSRLSEKFEEMKPSQLNELPAHGMQQIDDLLNADQKLRLKKFLSSDKKSLIPNIEGADGRP